MALIGNNVDTLLNGLSAFWHRFFRDLNDLQATYEGTEVLLGQVYLNFLSDVLNTSLTETPLFRKEFYKLITVREDQLVFREQGQALPVASGTSFYGNPGTNRYVYTSDTFYGAIPQLQDGIFSPKAALQSGIDYAVAGGEIQFKEDPTDPPLNGFARRQVTVGIGGKFRSNGLASWVLAGVEKGDTLYYSAGADLGYGSPLNKQNTAFSATVVQVTDSELSVSVDTPFPTFPAGAVPSGFSWRVMRLKDDGTYNFTLPRSPGGNAPFTDGQVSYEKTLAVTELSFWAVDVQVDDLSLYNTYGYFFTDKHLSSENYRSLIRGLMQLYVLGPALARVESALNLTAGLATVNLEGEVLQSYDNGILATGADGVLDASNVLSVGPSIFSAASVGGSIKIAASNYVTNQGLFSIEAYVSPTQVKLTPRTVFTLPGVGDDPDLLKWAFTMAGVQTVTTDQSSYTYPLETPLRSDVKDPAQFGRLVFKAFEALTTALRVTDYIQDPQWWHSITIPQELLPETPPERRVVTSQLFPNVIGPASNALIGDPGFYIGGYEVDDKTVASTSTVDDSLLGNPGFHHTAAFVLMDRFLKLHMFAVLVDSSVSLTGLLTTDLRKILQDVKPVHTALYFRPLTTFNDTIEVSDFLVGVGMALRQVEQVDQVDNSLAVGSGWLIGTTWKFAGPVGGELIINTTGCIPIAVGAVDPTIQPNDPTDTPPSTAPDLRWIDRPLFVLQHA